MPREAGAQEERCSGKKDRGTPPRGESHGSSGGYDAFARIGQPALEVADFIMHAVGRQARQKLKKRGEFVPDFCAVFHSVDQKLTSFMVLWKSNPSLRTAALGRKARRVKTGGAHRTPARARR